MSVPRPNMAMPSSATAVSASSATVTAGAAGVASPGRFRKPGKFGDFRQNSSQQAKGLMSAQAGGGPMLERSCVVNPSSSFMKYWDIWVVTLLVYTAFLTPFEIAFLETQLNALFFFNRLVDLSFLCDMIINFMMPFYDVDKQQWITSSWAIAKHYLMRWFVLDVLSILPIDTVVFFSASDTAADDATQFRFLRIIRLLRLMKLLRVFRASRILNRWKSVLGISNSGLSLSKFGMAATFVAHWSACLWALAPSVDSADTSWMVAANVDPNAGAADIYAACLYWSVMTLTTIGYGDIAPQTTLERMVAILCMLTGGSIYAYIIGAVCGIVSNIDKATSSYLQALDNLNRYMAEIKLPNDLRLQLREYFDHCRQLHRNKYYQGLLLQMSPSLRKAVAMHCHSVWIRAVPFFNAPEDDERSEFVASISVVLVPMAFAPLEKIVLEGEKTSKMYIIQRGLAIRRGNLLTTGDFFGEDMILTNARRAYSVRSLTFLDVYSLSKRGLRDALNAGEFAKTKKLIRRAAIKLALRREMMKVVVTSGMKRTMLDTIANAAAVAGGGAGGKLAKSQQVQKQRVLATARSRFNMSRQSVDDSALLGSRGPSGRAGAGTLAAAASRGQLLLGKRSLAAKKELSPVADADEADDGVDDLIDSYAEEVHGSTAVGSRRLHQAGGGGSHSAVLGASRRAAARAGGRAAHVRPVSDLLRGSRAPSVRSAESSVQSVQVVDDSLELDGDGDGDEEDDAEMEADAEAAQEGYATDPLDGARRTAERRDMAKSALEETLDRDEDGADIDVLAETPTSKQKPLVAPVSASGERISAARRFDHPKLEPLEGRIDEGDESADSPLATKPVLGSPKRAAGGAGDEKRAPMGNGGGRGRGRRAP
eukprot:CAMPEP_0203808006 /NCGR_PEP_ID=MMETSP0115-20131106/1370_1 /ASSEMBLY_ACC=CAM_ASM_000227 /TAXON_ID=33651 /ORGANISM="Bicosoecid sp, Strain ms1" /LENGTH=879 /DNA_ID=CAMNT_0050716689 /DNA_START=358 /DNA_END=2994 /DNA_ORIENTATION=-